MKTSRLYNFFCIAGIFGVAAVTILVSRRYDPTGRTNLSVYVGGAAFLLYLLLIIGYWFFKILARGYGSPDQETIGAAPPAGSFAVLKDWKTLFASMADPEDRIAQSIIAAQRRRVVLSFALTSLMALALVFGGVFLGWGESGAMAWALILILPVWFFAQIGILMVSRVGWDRLMKGLNFRPLADPSGRLPFLQTEVVYEGTRMGFPAYVAFGAEGTTVFIGKPRGVPSSTADAFKKILPRLEVWKEQNIEPSADGILIRRPRPGNFLWLYDLWLAENLASWKDGKESA